MCYNTRARGCSSMAERQLPKLNTRVRFPSPAPASSRTSYRSRRRFFFQNNRHRSLTSSLLLSKLNPLRWASIWVFFCKVRSTPFPATACGYCRKLRSLPCASFQIRSTLASDLFFSFARKVRSTTFPATACGYCRKLRSLPCASFQIRSTRLRICFLLSSGLRIVRDGVFSFRINAISHSLRRSSFPN